MTGGCDGTAAQCDVIPCSDTAPWEAQARMTMAQRNTPHNAAQDSGSEAGMTRERGDGEDGRDVACSVSNGGKTAAMAAGTNAQSRPYGSRIKCGMTP